MIIARHDIHHRFSFTLGHHILNLSFSPRNQFVLIRQNQLERLISIRARGKQAQSLVFRSFHFVMSVRSHGMCPYPLSLSRVEHYLDHVS